MRSHVVRFLRDSEGAVVADYVLLSAAIVGMSLSSVNSIRHGTGNLAATLGSALTSARVTLLCFEGSGSNGGLCASGTQVQGAGTGPVVVSPPGPLDSEPVIDEIKYENLLALSAETAEQYLKDLAGLSLDEIEKHLAEIETAFYEARSIGDTYRVHAALDQLMLVHKDVTMRPETDLFASQLQATYYDWIAAIN